MLEDSLLTSLRDLPGLPIVSLAHGTCHESDHISGVIGSSSLASTSATSTPPNQSPISDLNYNAKIHGNVFLSQSEPMAVRITSRHLIVIIVLLIQLLVVSASS